MFEYFTLLNITIALLWFISATFDYAGLCYVWQLKWYRLDRFKDFLTTKQGKEFMARYSLLYRSIIAIMVFLWPLNDIETLKYIIVAFFLTDLGVNAYRFLQKKVKRPQFSIKALAIILLSMSAEASWLVLSRDWQILILALMLRLFTISLVVLILNGITKIIKNIYIRRATQKMKAYNNLTVVGITGSYAKTSVKNFLAHMLSEKFNVIKTPQNINSHFGILRFILNTDFSDKDIFVIEIGADEIGDVKLICDIVKPKVGILTAINEQHMSLFGSIENTQTAKYELLRSLPDNGLAITNSDNKYCREFLHELTCKVQTFGVDEEFDPTLLITDIKTKPEGIYCKTEIIQDNKETEEREVQTKIFGEHNVLNLAPCTLAGLFLGMSRDEIIASDARPQDMSRALKPTPYGNSVILDDSYNSNPDGFKAALEMLNAQKSHQKRIVITRGMIELGNRSEEMHQKIGGEISFMADELVIITPDFVEPLTKGAVASKFNLKIRVITEPKELLDYVKSLKDTSSAILLENIIPQIVKDEIKQNA
ncbi:hypothetical protein C0581_02050 [Candidatus Parcubacteria bacterium]|nr:MAG: hypothetical protein C0581_02050 [Candidatus Parcubacteria bacterium]